MPDTHPVFTLVSWDRSEHEILAIWICIWIPPAFLHRTLRVQLIDRPYFFVALAQVPDLDRFVLGAAEQNVLSARVPVEVEGSFEVGLELLDYFSLSNIPNLNKVIFKTRGKLVGVEGVELDALDASVRIISEFVASQLHYLASRIRWVDDDPLVIAARNEEFWIPRAPI